MSVRFQLNGQAIEVNDADPHLTLLEWLRRSGRTGTKEGCAEGECGACAVAWLTRDEQGHTRLEAVNSCLIPLPAVHGRVVTSVEGVAQKGKLHVVQQALVEHAGSQCGYCTPGFVMSLFCEYYRPGREGYDREAISGNLCRCTGYRPIEDAARSLQAPPADDPKLAELSAARPSLPSIDHVGGGHRFVRPTELTQLFTLLEREPAATLIAGGTDLIVYANQRYQRFPLLVSLEALTELQVSRATPTQLTLGAGMTLAQLERWLDQHGLELPALEQVLPLFSSRLIRQRATIGGSLGTASPIGDLAPVLLALRATLVLLSRSGERELPLRDFFTGYRRTALMPNELIQGVRIPLPVPHFQRFYKVSKRVLDDISTVAAAFTLELDADATVREFSAAFGGIAATPLTADSLQDAARGQRWNAELIEELARQATSLGTPQDDFRGSASYRRALLPSLLRKFYAESMEAGGLP